MKPHKRRQTQNYPYYKLATWDPRSFTFRDGKVAFPTQAKARGAATTPGKYRLSAVNETGRVDMEPFEVI